MAATDFTIADLAEYTNNFRRQIGRGGFSTVYAGRIPKHNRHNLQKQKFAVKVNNDALDVQLFLNEIGNTPTADVPHVLRLIGYLHLGEQVYIVLPLAKRGPLSNSLTELSWYQVLNILKSIVIGIRHFHSADLVIGDLKPDNILLDKGGSPLLCDFGTVTPVNSPVRTTTFGYQDPCLTLRGARHKDDDIYAFGIIGLQLLMRRDVVRANGRDIVMDAIDLFRNTLSVVHEQLRRSGCTSDQATSLSRLLLNIVITPKQREYLARMRLALDSPTDDPLFRPSIDYVEGELAPLTVTLKGVLANQVHRVFH